MKVKSANEQRNTNTLFAKIGQPQTELVFLKRGYVWK